MGVNSRAELRAEGERLAGSAAVAARSDLESGAIAALMRSRGLEGYIDVGCWYGFLLRRVLEAARPRWAVAVDAVAEFADFAREQVAPLGALVDFRVCVLVPEAMRGRGATVRIDPEDTSKSGLSVTGGFEAGAPPAAGIADLLSEIGRERVTRSYLKIDAEGCDEALVVDLLEAGFRPGVVHFEVLREGFEGSGALGALARAGYRVPGACTKHPYYSLACSAGEPVVIGFRPDVVYRSAEVACA